MRFTEPLNNGLVTSRSPILLREGELQRADNAYYQPNDTGLHAAPTETTAMVAPGLGYFTPTGIVHCAFDFVEAKCDLTLASTAVVITPLIINNVTTTNTSLIITAPSGNNFVSILKGATISGTGIPANTTVTSIDSPTQITMSLAATATGTPNLTFTNAKFSNVTAGASIAGPGIPDGTTASSVGATGTSLVLSVAATRTGQSKLIVKADNLVVLQIDNKYKKAKSGAAGTALSFSDLDTGITEGTALEQVHYNNLHVLLNGKHENRVLMADGLTRSHGLNPVTASCNPIPTTGVWALKDGVGFYAYWTTEYDSINDIESDYNPGVDPAGKPIKPPMVEITSITTQAVQVTRPARVNDTATHWRLYRSVKYTSTTAKSAAKENQYPNGWLVAEIELRDDNQQDTFVDGGDLSQTVAATAGNASSGAGASGLVWANTGAATGVINNGGATNDTNSATLTYAGAKESLIPLSLTNFSIPSVGSPVTGITITVTGRRVGGGKLILEVLSTRHPFSTTIPIGRKVVPYTTSNASYTLGGTSELWGRKWDPSDFANGKFQINCYGSVVVTSDKVTVDAISVIVSHGESQDSGTGAYLNNITDPYPGIVVSPYGFQISAGRGGKPPKATTGDVFQDSLLLNDVEDSSIARYSFPSRIDLFPAPYFLNFDTKEQDEITLIRTVGNVVIIGLKHQIYRANYLPRDTDAEFERGRAVEVVETAHGIAGRTAGVVFTLPGFGQALAYANNYGVFMTDGYRVRPLTSDLDWWGTVNLSYLSNSKFINNTELQVLEFYYVPVDVADLSAATKQLYFHYHPSHLKGDPRAPELKVSGPRDTSTKAICTAGLPDGTRKVYITKPHVVGESHGAVYYSNRLASTLDTAHIQTRAIPAAQLGNEWRSNELALGYTLRDYLATSPGTFAITADVTKTGAVDRTSSSKSITVPTFAGSGLTNPKSRRISKTFVPESGQAMSFTINPSVTGTGRCSFEFLIVDAEGQGIENPT